MAIIIAILLPSVATTYGRKLFCIQIHLNMYYVNYFRNRSISFNTKIQFGLFKVSCAIRVMLSFPRFIHLYMFMFLIHIVIFDRNNWIVG
jgi:hypothetical protein